METECCSHGIRYGSYAVNQAIAFGAKKTSLITNADNIIVYFGINFILTFENAPAAWKVSQRAERINLIHHAEKALEEIPDEEANRIVRTKIANVLESTRQRVAEWDSTTLDNDEDYLLLAVLKHMSQLMLKSQSTTNNIRSGQIQGVIALKQGTITTEKIAKITRLLTMQSINVAISVTLIRRIWALVSPCFNPALAEEKINDLKVIFTAETSLALYLLLTQCETTRISSIELIRQAVKSFPDFD